MVKALNGFNYSIVQASGCLNEPHSRKLAIFPPLFDIRITVHVKGDPHATGNTRENCCARKKEDDCALAHGHCFVIMVDYFKEWMTTKRVELLISINTIYMFL